MSEEERDGLSFGVATEHGRNFGGCMKWLQWV